MTEAVFDFAAINRRLNRKPEPVAFHASDCATNNAPALPVGPCDCIAALRAELEVTESDLLSLRLQADKRLIESDGWETLWAY